MKNLANSRFMNWRHFTVLPVLFAVFASGCKTSSGGGGGGAPPGFADINITAVASDGKTPLSGYQAVFSPNFNQSSLIELDAKDSQVTTDSNGKAHLHIEFTDPPVLSSAEVSVLIFPPGCNDVGCGVGATSFSLSVGQTVNETIVTNVKPSGGAKQQSGASQSSGVANIVSLKSGIPLEGHTPLVVTSQMDPAQYLPPSTQALKGEAAMEKRNQAPTYQEQVLPHGGTVTQDSGN